MSTLSLPSAKSRLAVASIAEAATYLGLSPDSVRAAIARGELSAVRLGRAIRIWSWSLVAAAGEESQPTQWPTGCGKLRDVAVMFGVHPAHIRRLIQSGDLPGYRVGRSHRVRWDRLRDHFASLAAIESEASNG